MSLSVWSCALSGGDKDRTACVDIDAKHPEEEEETRDEGGGGSQSSLQMHIAHPI